MLSQNTPTFSLPKGEDDICIFYIWRILSPSSLTPHLHVRKLCGFRSVGCLADRQQVGRCISPSGRAISSEDLDENLTRTWPISVLGLTDTVPKSYARWLNRKNPLARAGGAIFRETDRYISAWSLTITTNHLIISPHSRHAKPAPRASSLHAKPRAVGLRLRPGIFASTKFFLEGTWLQQNTPAFSLPKK